MNSTTAELVRRAIVQAEEAKHLSLDPTPAPDKEARTTCLDAAAGLVRRAVEHENTAASLRAKAQHLIEMARTL